MLFILVLAFFGTQAEAFTARTGLGGGSQTWRELVMDLDSRLTCVWEPLRKDMVLRVTLRRVLEGKSMLQVRVSSPSGDLSEWSAGEDVAIGHHNVTEDGDYEICVTSNVAQRIQLHVSFYHPEEVQTAFQKYIEANDLGKSLMNVTHKLFDNLYSIRYSIKFYNTISYRDEERQQRNSTFIANYVIVFVFSNIIVAIIQIVVIRRFFRVDEKRIRI